MKRLVIIASVISLLLPLRVAYHHNLYLSFIVTVDYFPMVFVNLL